DALAEIQADFSREWLRLCDEAKRGVQAQSCGLCTVQDSRFFSYRRDRETGRMALLAWLDAR
ncbi:laccase domain-containing protein, partial [Bordetella bronchiseptica]